MENAADALKMAAAILIFIIALGSSFSLFGTAKHTADSIINIRDKQAYLEASEEKVGGILYVSSATIAGEKVVGVTTTGDRVVSKSDIISTVYRYANEKYAVTIIDSTGDIKARFDSTTETQYINSWNIRSEEEKKSIAEVIGNNLSNKYVTNVEVTIEEIEDLYRLTEDKTGKRICGTNWYGNNKDIISRINIELNGGEITRNGLTYEIGELKDPLIKILDEANEIIEVTNEIDQSKYLEDEGVKTELLQQYNMPTVEIIYIIM